MPRPKHFVDISCVVCVIGMPSDHSQFMCLYCTYVILYLLHSGRITLNHTQINIYHAGTVIGSDVQWKLFGSCVSIIITLIVAYSRIFLGVHSIPQVIVGCLIGVVLGIIWYSVSYYMLYPYVYPYIESSRLGKSLYLQDNSMISNQIHTDYMLRQQYKATLAQNKTQ